MCDSVLLPDIRPRIVTLTFNILFVRNLGGLNLYSANVYAFMVNLNMQKCIKSIYIMHKNILNIQNKVFVMLRG